MFIILAICIFSGPFGTFAEMNLIERVIYWTPQAVFAWFIAGLAIEFAWSIYPTDKRYQHGLLSAFWFAILYAPVDFLITRSGIFGTIYVKMQFWEVLLTNFAFAMCVVIWVLLNEKAHVAATAKPKPRLYSRLPEGTTGDITHITVKDHYVEVYTEDGNKHRLLMRFADAVQEMDCTQGYCTHRSHWVAQAHVKKGCRDGNKEFVQLNCGKEIPVSKTYRETLVQAGFFQVAPR